MDGPTWGTLEAPGLVSLPIALACFVIDEDSGVAAFQELSLSGSPSVVFHVFRLGCHTSVKHTLPFGAYVFTTISETTIGVRNQWAKQTHEIPIPPRAF